MPHLRRLPPDERREMLIDAVLPLVAECGTKVTTRQIAQAAGVAEGTIFRVFADKDALVRAAVARALDIGPVIDELAAVDPAEPLPQRLVVITRIMQRRLIMVFNLMIAMNLHSPPEDIEAHRSAARPQHARVHNEIERLLEPDRDSFRVPVSEVARLLRLLTFSGSHPMITDGDLLSAEEIAAVLLDGTRRHPSTEPGVTPC